MWVLRAAVLVLVSAWAALALPSIPKDLSRFPDDLFQPLPVVIWHGLGDSAYSPWLLKLRKHIETMYPGIFVHLVAIKPTLFSDQRATVFGNVNDQIDLVHRELNAIPELRHGFDAVGFSQGGQFMRGYVERYNAPRVRNLVTFGSQHMGITDLPACQPFDALCHTVHGLVQGRVYSDYAQKSIVTAQYFRDTRTEEQFALYKERNKFLYDINNEGPEKNATYKANLERLDKFVMVKFSEESTVVPVTSSWFAAYPDPDRHEGRANATIPLRQSALYEEDWVGVRALDRKGALAFHECPGMHMHLSPECIALTFGQYIGRPRVVRPWSEHVHSCRATTLSASVLLWSCIIFVLLGLGIWRMRSRRVPEHGPIHLVSETPSEVKSY